MQLSKCWIHSGLYYEIILNLRWAMVSSCGPPGSAIFWPGVEKRVCGKYTKIHIWKKLGKRPLWAKLKTVWRVFAATSPSRGLKNRWQYRKNLVPWRLSLFWNQVDPILGSFQFCTKARYRVSTKACNQTTVEFILACILSSIWIYIALIANLNLIVFAYVELTLSLSWDCFELMFEIALNFYAWDFLRVWELTTPW